jgi:hypothetical protein
MMTVLNMSIYSIFIFSTSYLSSAFAFFASSRFNLHHDEHTRTRPMRDRGKTLANAPLEDLLTILLRQFKRPLAVHGVTISDADAAQIAAELATRAPDTPQRQAIRDALAAVIGESEAVLARWGLTFEQSLETTMDAIKGWETTAEFLEIANEKTNAELRIAAGAALLLALGDARHADKISIQLARDPNETEAQIGARIVKWTKE